MMIDYLQIFVKIWKMLISWFIKIITKEMLSSNGNNKEQ